MGFSVKDSLKWFWREWLRALLIVAIVMGTFRSAVADWNDVPTGSMKPTILEGDRIFVNKLAYDLRVPFTLMRIARWGDPLRGDIVVFRSPADGKRLVKRVVGLPGDRITLVQNKLIINGRDLNYAPLEWDQLVGFEHADQSRRIVAKEQLGEHQHPIMITPGQAAVRSFGPVDVPPGHYFVMGDNRDESGDSRFFGFVPRSYFMGKATAVAASVDPKNYFLPRWQRFFRGLP